MAVKKDIIGADVQIGVNEAQANLAKLTKQTNELRESNKALRMEKARLEAEGKKESKEYDNLTKRIRENNKAIRANNEQSKALEKTLGLVGMSANQLNKKARQLKSQMNGLSKAANPEKWDQLNKELEATNKQLDKVRAGSKKTGGFLNSLKGAAGGLLPAFGWGAIAAGAIAAGKEIFNLAKRTMEYRKEVQKLTDLQGQDLADFTANLVASSQTFKQEVKDLAIANNALAEAFNISNQEAQVLIDQGFIAGADATEEFLDKLKEYPVQFEAAGLSAEQTIALMTQEAKSGVFSDKGSDVIKEATLRLREMTPAAQDALAKIGISSDELAKKLREGSITYFDAIQMVSGKLGELPPQSVEVGTALADIFGGPGEDAGLQYILMLNEVQTDLDEVIKRAGETGDVQLKMLAANQKLQKAWSDMLGTGTSMFDGLIASGKILLADVLIGLSESLAAVRDWFVTSYNDSAPFRGVIQSFFLSWKIAIDSIKTSLILLWDVLKGTTNLILAIFTFDKEKIKAAWNEGVNAIKDTVIEGATNVANDFVDAYNKTVADKIIIPSPQSPEIQQKRKEEVAAASGVVSKDAAAFTSESLAPTEEEELAEIEAELARDQELFNEKYKIQQAYYDNERKIRDDRLRQIEDDQKKEAQIEAARIKFANKSLDAFVGIVGEESALGQTALIAKKLLAAREAFLSIQAGFAKTAALGFPQNIPALIGYGVQTAGVVASIASVPTGKKDGGYTTQSSSDDDIADFVHSNEFVANAKAVRNPTVRPYLDAINVAQQNGTIESINLPSAVGGGGSSSGGGSSPSAPAAVDTPSNATNPEAFAIALANVLRQHPLKSVMDYDYKKESEKEMEDLEADAGF